MLMRLFTYINKRWAKISFSVFSSSMLMLHFTLHTLKQSQNNKPAPIRTNIWNPSLKHSCTYSKRRIQFGGYKQFYTNFASNFSEFKRRIFIFLAQNCRILKHCILNIQCCLSENILKHTVSKKKTIQIRFSCWTKTPCPSCTVHNPEISTPMSSQPQKLEA